MATSLVNGSAVLRAGGPERFKKDADCHDAIRRVQADYREMPGLSVTLQQGCRLWSLPPALCASILEQLIAQGTLKRRGDQYSLQ
jgi:hypothetical protein